MQIAMHPPPPRQIHSSETREQEGGLGTFIRLTKPDFLGKDTSWTSQPGDEAKVLKVSSNSCRIRKTASSLWGDIKELV